VLELRADIAGVSSSVLALRASRHCTAVADGEPSDADGDCRHRRQRRDRGSLWWRERSSNAVTHDCNGVI
jgi:hypothetical protein